MYSPGRSFSSSSQVAPGRRSVLGLAAAVFGSDSGQVSLFYGSYEGISRGFVKKVAGFTFNDCFLRPAATIGNDRLAMTLGLNRNEAKILHSRDNQSLTFLIVFGHFIMCQMTKKLDITAS